MDIIFKELNKQGIFWMLYTSPHVPTYFREYSTIYSCYNSITSRHIWFSVLSTILMLQLHIQFREYLQKFPLLWLIDCILLFCKIIISWGNVYFGENFQKQTLCTIYPVFIILAQKPKQKAFFNVEALQMDMIYLNLIEKSFSLMPLLENKVYIYIYIHTCGST